MADQDRLYVDKNKIEFVRGINKSNKYLKFDNQKDLFMYAMTLGVDCPTSFTGIKEALFLEKDMNYEDMALIYSIVLPELDKIEELTDKEKVYTIAQNMANTGFSFIKEEVDNNSFESLTVKLLLKLDEKFKKITQEGILTI